MLFVGCKEGYFDEVAKMSIMKGKKRSSRLLSTAIRAFWNENHSFSSGAGSRTPDIQNMSLPLYQLSYAAKRPFRSR